jgi:hypothetical protein
MTARADAARVEADLESARQALRAGVAYLAAVTRKVQGLRAADRVVLCGAGVASLTRTSAELAEAEHQQFVAMVALDDLSGQARAAEAALAAAQAETERAGG